MPTNQQLWEACQREGFDDESWRRIAKATLRDGRAWRRLKEKLGFALLEKQNGWSRAAALRWDEDWKLKIGCLDVVFRPDGGPVPVFTPGPLPARLTNADGRCESELAQAERALPGLRFERAVNGDHLVVSAVTLTFNGETRRHVGDDFRAEGTFARGKYGDWLARIPGPPESRPRPGRSVWLETKDGRAKLVTLRGVVWCDDKAALYSLADGTLGPVTLPEAFESGLDRNDFARLRQGGFALSEIKAFARSKSMDWRRVRKAVALKLLSESSDWNRAAIRDWNARRGRLLRLGATLDEGRARPALKVGPLPRVLDNLSGRTLDGLQDNLSDFPGLAVAARLVDDGYGVLVESFALTVDGETTQVTGADFRPDGNLTTWRGEYVVSILRSDDAAPGDWVWVETDEGELRFLQLGESQGVQADLERFSVNDGEVL